MSFAILRTKKFGSFGEVGAAGHHIHRTRETKNADPERSALNQFSPGNGSTLDRVKARIPGKVRKNGVVAVEVLMTASPQYFLEKSPEQIDSWKQQSLEWAEKFFGGKENLVDWALHMDETTPHIHAVIVPIDPKGKLNCRHFLNGKEKLSAMQDDYAEAMKNFNLDRGIRKSKAQHQDIKKYYLRVNAGIQSMDDRLNKIESDIAKIQPLGLKDMLNPEKWFAEHLQPVLKKVTDYLKKIYAAKDELQTNLKEQKNTNQRLSGQLDKAQKAINTIFKTLGMKPEDLKNEKLTNTIKMIVGKFHQRAKIQEHDQLMKQVAAQKAQAAAAAKATSEQVQKQQAGQSSSQSTSEHSPISNPYKPPKPKFK